MKRCSTSAITGEMQLCSIGKNSKACEEKASTAPAGPQDADVHLAFDPGPQPRARTDLWAPKTKGHILKVIHSDATRNCTPPKCPRVDAKATGPHCRHTTCGPRCAADTHRPADKTAKSLGIRCGHFPGCSFKYIYRMLTSRVRKNGR